MSEPTNADRAEWARLAVDAYAEHTRYDPREQSVSVTGPEDEEGRNHAEEVMSDLLCDMRHLAALLGVSWNVLLGRSLRDYSQDVTEETGIRPEVPAEYEEKRVKVARLLCDVAWSAGKWDATMAEIERANLSDDIELRDNYLNDADEVLQSQPHLLGLKTREQMGLWP